MERAGKWVTTLHIGIDDWHCRDTEGCLERPSYALSLCNEL